MTVKFSLKKQDQVERFMQQQPTISCPSCRTEIKLNETLAAPLLEATRADYEKRMAQADAAIAQREVQLQQHAAEVEASRASVAEVVATRLAAERVSIAREEGRRAKSAVELEIKERDRKLGELATALEVREMKLAEAQQQQALFLAKERDLQDAQRELALTVERQVREKLQAVRDKARGEVEDSLKLKVAEKEEQIAGMQRQIEDLRRRAEQGSQQLQGEVLELEFESILAARFPMDLLEPVAKGEFGGDILQRVIGPAGQPCGSILWETKRTKKWSATWLPKLRDDQRSAKADFALMVSEALPSGVKNFDLIDGVYVTSPRCSVPIAMMLRQSLLSLANSRIAQDGQATKMEQVYTYLTGSRFRHRIEAIVEKFSDMNEDLAREKKATMRLWAKREVQIQGVIESTVGMYGDLQGIAGRALMEIPLLKATDAVSDFSQDAAA